MSKFMQFLKLLQYYRTLDTVPTFPKYLDTTAFDTTALDTITLDELASM